MRWLCCQHSLINPLVGVGYSENSPQNPMAPTFLETGARAGSRAAVKTRPAAMELGGPGWGRILLHNFPPQTPHGRRASWLLEGGRK